MLALRPIKERTMIWRISKITKSGSNVYDPTPYLTEDEALAAIKKDLDAGWAR
jgi:hypothetical protein